MVEKTGAVVLSRLRREGGISPQAKRKEGTAQSLCPGVSPSLRVQRSMWDMQLKEALVEPREHPPFPGEDVCMRLGESQPTMPCGGILKGFDVGDPGEGPWDQSEETYCPLGSCRGGS